MAARRTREAASSWPEVVIDRVFHRDFVLVLGAGVSAGSLNGDGKRPPGWHTLLQSLRDQFLDTASDKQALNGMLRRGDYLGAAEVLKSAAEGRGKGADFYRTIEQAVDGKAPSPFKPNALHEALLRLDPSIVVTTNYDKLWERASDSGYHVHFFDSKTLGHAVRVGSPVLVKLHGSTDSGQELILTRTDFSRVRNAGAHVLDVLQALFMTRTALFVGYGFADPDVHLLLENVLGMRGGPAAHYYLTGDSIRSHERVVLTACYGTDVLTYRDGEHAEVERMIAALADEVDARRAAALV